MPISAAGNRPAGPEPRFTPVTCPAEHGFMPVRRFAEHGFMPVRRSAEHGFTLVELMVVITVIGLAAAIAVWVMPDPQGRLADEAARFATRARAAHDQAIVTARPVSLWVTPGGYGFDQRIGGRWVAMTEKPLRLERWREGTRAVIGDASGRVRVVFDSTGLADRPLDVRLQRRGAAAGVRIDGDGSARVDG